MKLNISLLVGGLLAVGIAGLTATRSYAAEFSVTGPRPIGLRSADDGRELILTFGQGIEPAPFEAAAKRAADSIEFTSVGYDSVLIRFTAPMDYAITYEADGYRLSLTRKADADRGKSDPADDGRVEVQLARIDLLEGAGPPALARLRALEAKLPGDADVKAMLADAEQGLGLWRKSRETRTHALALRPFDDGLIESQNRLGRDQGPRLKVESDMLWVEKNYRQIISLFSINAMPQPASGALANTEIGAIVENRNLETDRGITLQGQTIYFVGARRRAEFYGHREHDDDSDTRASLLAGPASVGGALGHTRRDLGGLSRLRVEYQQPYFDIVSGLINMATRDSVELRHEIKLTPELMAFANSRLSRYGVDTHSDVSRNLMGGGGMRYGRNFASVFGSVGYTMEGEYLLNEHKLNTSTGGEFRALPLVDRELHVFDANISQELFAAVRYDIQMGYGMNRFGAEGAFANIGIAYGPADWPVELGLRGGWSRFARFGEAGDLTRAGGYFSWRF